MFRFFSNLAGKLRGGACLAVVTATVILAASGCKNVDLRGDPYPEDATSDLVQRLRGVDDQAQSFAFSNKARQIERDCGVQ